MVEYASYSDMKNAVRKLDGAELNGRRIKLFEDSRRRKRYVLLFCCDCTVVFMVLLTADPGLVPVPVIAAKEAGHVLVIVILIPGPGPDPVPGLVHDLGPRTDQPLVNDQRKDHALVMVPGNDQPKERTVIEVAVVVAAGLGQRRDVIHVNDHQVGRVSDRDPLL